jgi:hypothetical protein
LPSSLIRKSFCSPISSIWVRTRVARFRQKLAMGGEAYTKGKIRSHVASPINRDDLDSLQQSLDDQFHNIFRSSWNYIHADHQELSRAIRNESHHAALGQELIERRAMRMREAGPAPISPGVKCSPANQNVYDHCCCRCEMCTLHPSKQERDHAEKNDSGRGKRGYGRRGNSRRPR